MTVQAAVGGLLRDKGRVGCALVAAFFAYLALRGCVPALGGDRLPAELETAVTESLVHCDQDFPIYSGDVRMPTCDSVTTRLAGEGALPLAEQAAGATRAVCYHVDVEHLFWGENGSWKHDMAWALRTYSKVAVLRDGRWVLFPDEEEGDRARWSEYQCPGEYEASSGLVPRRS